MIVVLAILQRVLSIRLERFSIDVARSVNTKDTKDTKVRHVVFSFVSSVSHVFMPTEQSN